MKLWIDIQKAREGRYGIYVKAAKRIAAMPEKSFEKVTMENFKPRIFWKAVSRNKLPVTVLKQGNEWYFYRKPQ